LLSLLSLPLRLLPLLSLTLLALFALGFLLPHALAASVPLASLAVNHSIVGCIVFLWLIFIGRPEPTKPLFDVLGIQEFAVRSWQERSRQKEKDHGGRSEPEPGAGHRPWHTQFAQVHVATETEETRRHQQPQAAADVADQQPEDV